MNLSDIKYGLFKYEVKDYYSILGAPINADAKQIRMRYLQIAKQLHPDTSISQTSDEKDKGTQILSKLVNPAYENLYKDKLRKECQLILSEVGRRLATDAYQITIATDTAKKLLQEEKNLDNLYQEMITKLAAGLYVDVNTVIKKISLLSELNMVYLMRKKQQEYQQAEGGNFSSSSSIFSVQQTEPSINKATFTNNDNQSSSNQNQKESVRSGISEKDKTTGTSGKGNPPNKNERLMQSALRNQEDGNIEQGIIDLREALKLDPNDASCHALIGSLYLKQGNLAYARIHIKKGADLDRNNARVKESQQELKEFESKDKKQNQKSSSSSKSIGKDTKDKGKAKSSSSSTNKSKPKDIKGKGKDDKGKDDKGKKEAPKIFGIPLW